MPSIRPILQKAWIALYVIVALAVCVLGITQKDYAGTGFVGSILVSRIIDPKKSRTSKIAQGVLMGVTVVCGIIFMYIDIRRRRAQP